MPPELTPVTMHVSRPTPGPQEAARTAVVAPVQRTEDAQSDDIQPDERYEEPQGQPAALAPETVCCWRLGESMRHGGTLALSGIAGLASGIAIGAAVNGATGDTGQDDNLWIMAAGFGGAVGLPLLCYVGSACLQGTAVAVQAAFDRLNQAPAPSPAELV